MNPAIPLTLLPLSILGSVEFYVIAAVIAAAILAFTARGGAKGPVRQYLLPGVLSKAIEPREASIELLCCDDGSVVLHRHGVAGITLSGAVSLAVEVSGFDVRIKERTVAGKRGDTDGIDTASFVLDFMAPERYFISYTAEDAGLFAALTLHNRPGIHVEKRMQ
ncbi:MAG: hypothetical protein NC212_07570 [Staphylococcus sp.]|nr:hypothetical protein [Staphylococcus sp.]